VADNVTLNAGTGGDTVRTIDRSGVETQVVQIDAGGAGAEALVSSAAPLPTYPAPFTVTGTLNTTGSVTVTDLKGASTLMLEGVATSMTTHTGLVEGLTAAGVWEALRFIYSVGASGSIAVFGAAGTGAVTIGANSLRLAADVAGYSQVRYRAATFSGTLFAVTMICGYGQLGPLQHGNLLAQSVSGTVTCGHNAGSNLIGDFGIQLRANATGAASRGHIVSAGTTNATVVKASAGRLVGWALANTNAAWRYVKLHNSASSPTAGTGVVQTIAIPPNGLAQMSVYAGIAFSSGIAITIVTGAADSDNTAVGANDIVGDLFYA